MLLPFREMQRQVQAKIQNTNVSVSNINDLRPKIKDFLNNRYARVYRSYFFQEIQEEYDLTLTASQNEYVFNDDVEPNGIISIFDVTNGVSIEESTVQDHDRTYAPRYERTGNVLADNPDTYRLTGVHTVKAKMSQAEKISVVSSSASDITPNVVRVEGLVGGVRIGEEITLTGTTAADSVNTYDADQRVTISVDGTSNERKSVVGYITATGKVSGTVYSVITPDEYAHKYQWFKVSPVPKSSGTQPTWEIKYKRYFRRMENDTDIPLFDCSIELIQGAYADALFEDGLESEGMRAEEKFVNLVKELQITRLSQSKADAFMPKQRVKAKREHEPYRWV